MNLPKTSRAAVITKYKAPLEIIELPIPDELEPGAILVKTDAATICGSDIHIMDGDVSHHYGEGLLPVIMGHEMVGTIVKLGPGVSHDSVGQEIKEGDRLVWENATCDSCFNCVTLGERTLCEDRKTYSLTRSDKYPYLLGAFSEYIYVYPKSRRLRVPEELPSAWVAASTCALRTMMHAFERLGHVEPWQTAVIQGSGPLGLYMTAILDNAGVGNIIVVGAPQKRLDLAAKWGAKRVISIEEVPNAKDRVELVKELTNGRGADIVIEASGAPGAFAEGLDLAAKGARYVVVGQVGEQMANLVASKIVFKQLTILGTMSGDISHYNASLQFLLRTREKYNFGEMLSNEYRLDEINKAVASFRAGNEIKPVIIP